MSDIIPEGILYGNLGIGSGTTNYNDLDNKPQINSVTLQGNKTASELGLVGTSDIPVTSVNGETGAVVLDGTDIEFSEGVSLNEKIIAVEQEIPVIAYPVTSVNSKTGAVVLDGTDINYQAGVTINQKIDAVEAEIPTIPVTSVNGETGAVVLDGTDIEYSSGVSVNSQIDTLMNYIPVYGNTASGSIATFDTSLALPLQDCTIDINAVQESGTPTPSSPKAISGFTGANITNHGINFWDEQWEVGAYDLSTGQKTTANNRIRTKNYIAVLPSTTYFNCCPDIIIALFYDRNKTFLSQYGFNANSSFVTPSNAYYMNFHVATAYGTTYNNNISINNPATITTFQAYNGHTTAISWQSEAGTVYGGSLDVTSGVLTVTHGITTINDCITNRTTSYTNPVFYGAITGLKPQTASVKSDYFNVIAGKSSASAFANASSNYDFAINSANTGSSIQVFLRCDDYTDVPTLKTNCGSAVVIYELATPTTYQLTPTQISAIVGTNNVFTDTNGDTSVIYACSLKDYIDSQ